MTVVFVPGVRIVAVLAAQRTARQKTHKTQSRAIHRATHFLRMHVAGDIVLLLDLLDVARMDRVVVLRLPCSPRALASDVKIVAAADDWLAHAYFLLHARRGTCD